MASFMQWKGWPIIVWFVLPLVIGFAIGVVYGTRLQTFATIFSLLLLSVWLRSVLSGEVWELSLRIPLMIIALMLLSFAFIVWFDPDDPDGTLFRYCCGNAGVKSAHFVAGLISTIAAGPFIIETFVDAIISRPRK